MAISCALVMVCWNRSSAVLWASLSFRVSEAVAAAAGRVAEDVGEDGGRGLVGPGAGEAGGFVDGEAVVVVAGLALAVDDVCGEDLHQPWVPGEHRVQVGGHGGGRGAPVDRIKVGQRELAPHLVGGEQDEVVLVLDVPVHGRGGGVEPVAQGAHVEPLEALGVQELDGGADDLVPGEGVACHGLTVRSTCTKFKKALARCSSPGLPSSRPAS